MNVTKFWEIVKSLNDAISEEEYYEILDKSISNSIDYDLFEITYEKYDKILEKYGTDDNDIKIFIAIYDRYYEILHTKIFNELFGENKVIDITEDTYYLCITSVITLGLDTFKKMYKSSCEEIISYIMSYGYNSKCCNLHDYFKRLKCENWKFIKTLEGVLVYDKSELSDEIKLEIEKTLESSGEINK